MFVGVKIFLIFFFIEKKKFIYDIYLLKSFNIKFLVDFTKFLEGRIIILKDVDSISRKMSLVNFFKISIKKLK